MKTKIEIKSIFGDLIFEFEKICRKSERNASRK